MLYTNSLLSIDINYSFERRRCLKLSLFYVPAYAQRTGEILQLTFCRTSKLFWWNLCYPPEFSGDNFCQWTNAAVGIICAKPILCFRMQDFVLEEVELFSRNKLPSKCSFFCLVCKLRSDSGFHECICYSEVFSNKMKYSAVQTAYWLFVVQDLSPP